MFIPTGEPSFLLGFECHLPSVGIPGDFHFLPDFWTDLLVPFHCTFSPSQLWYCIIFSEVWKRLIPFLIFFLESTGTSYLFTHSWFQSIPQLNVTVAQGIWCDSSLPKFRPESRCWVPSARRSRNTAFTFIPGPQTGLCVSQEYST